jgi:hypothetical protein
MRLNRASFSHRFKETRNLKTLIMSREFRSFPAELTRTWSLQEISLSTHPTEEGVLSQRYESQIREVVLTAKFAEPIDLEEPLYLSTDDEYEKEWEFVERQWRDLNSSIALAVANYNKEVLSRTAALKLARSTILGRARTQSVSKRVQDRAAEQHNRSVHNSPLVNTNHGRIETIYAESTRAPTLRSVARRRGSGNRPGSILAWMAGV